MWDGSGSSRRDDGKMDDGATPPPGLLLPDRDVKGAFAQRDADSPPILLRVERCCLIPSDDISKSSGVKKA